jgi:hypothetical protein
VPAPFFFFSFLFWSFLISSNLISTSHSYNIISYNSQSQKNNCYFSLSQESQSHHIHNHMNHNHTTFTMSSLKYYTKTTYTSIKNQQWKNIKTQTWTRGLPRVGSTYPRWPSTRHGAHLCSRPWLHTLGSPRPPLLPAVPGREEDHYKKIVD